MEYSVDTMQPLRPRHMPEHAALCLEALTRKGLGHKISLGGAFGLLHYHDYRSTHDVDAWWDAATSEDERREIVDVVKETLEEVGKVRLRTWGDVVSIELLRGAKKVFSFQIARRSVQLEPSEPAPWTDVLLDSFHDLLANKMVALVERGAPRDFRDIYSVCQTDLTTPGECWRLWRERQERAGGGSDPQRARLAVELHLTRIVRHRPLDRIADKDERAWAERARRWYKTELLDALLD